MTSTRGRGPSDFTDHVDGVREVEPALGLHGVAEHARDVLVFLRELELPFRLVVLEIVGAQRTP